MPDLDIEVNSVRTHAEAINGQIVQWAEVSLWIPKGFDIEGNGKRILKKLQNALDLVGRP